MRKLVAQAAESGDYAAIRRLAGWAETVHAMIIEATTGTTASSAHPAPAIAARSSGTRIASLREKPYPHFFRRGDELIKVGWSKSEGKEYHHRAPRRAVDALLAAITQAGARGHVFTSDDILPLKPSPASDGTDTIPDYQAYVALAWLRDLSLVEQHGRKGGYTLTPTKQPQPTITAAWGELSEWQG
ncbi:MAG: hypothetical protein WD042_06385 [Phycisphaeraceae bacterium]